MSQQLLAPQAEADRQETLPDRIKRLAGDDAQFRAASPDPAVVEAKCRPGLRLAEVVREVMEGYGDRPALGRRAREVVADPATGRTVERLLPRFDTISYRDLWARARAIAAEWHGHGVQSFAAGDFLCVLGFTSPEYATLLLAGIHLGGVNVPLQFGGPASQHADIMAETGPRILAASIDAIDTAVDAILAGAAPGRLIVFDYEPRDDDQRERFEAARERLAAAASPVVVDTLDDVARRGADLPAAPLHVAGEGEDPLAWLFYTSGSTGTPKGAIFTESLVATTWTSKVPMPVVTLSFMPMSHLIGNGYLFMTLANGGTSYCAPRSDLSTLLEDLSLVRPTMASLVPRICELFHQHWLGEVDRLVAAGQDRAAAGEVARLDMRTRILGGRLLSVGSGSASLAPEIYAWMEQMLGIHMPIGYSSTEIAGGTVLIDWKVQRPPVIAYKLDDVPELGYFRTDKPHPRGELLVKSDRNMGGYYKRPELTSERYDEDGFYRTGDVMAELGPDHLVFVDRRNNVIKLSQGEFVAISRLEALYTHSPAIQQIYIYGTSERSYLLAVVVPTAGLRAALDEGTPVEQAKAQLRRALQQIADEQGLAGYEVPRDFLIEREPFSVANGLLTGVGKHQRPKLKERYAERLEALYARLAQDQLAELSALRTAGADRPVLETVLRALQASLGLAAGEVSAASRFAELGGDSLSALTFSTLLEEVYGIEVPVGVIIGPAADVAHIVDYIEAERRPGAKRPSFATIHDAGDGRVHARELMLDRFIAADLVDGARDLPAATAEIRSVLLTGATGFLGRFQAVAWLERLAATGGTLTCIVRGADAADARRRFEAAFASDPTLLDHVRTLGADRLEVLPGDIGAPNLGLDEATWTRLAGSVDAIVHPAAHVNHVLPYNQLFTANVVGTAELIRLAITARIKRIDYVSTLGINTVADHLVDEDGDVRRTIPSGALTDGYANGYGLSKWASEVLLREANERCGVPVAVFRPGMILAHGRYAGQLNVPDMFTRLLFSLAVTGVAPATFYAANARDGRPRARYDGFTVDVLAEAITRIGARAQAGYHSYNLAGAPESDVSLDSFVDWMIGQGVAIERIDEYDRWLARFETAMRALPEAQRQGSLLALLGPYKQPQHATTRSDLPAERFREAAAAVGVALPELSSALIEKYVADLRHLALL